MASATRILVTGGSGFVGQFLLHNLHSDYQIVYTYGSRPLANTPANVIGVQVNLADGSGLAELLQQHGPFAAVVNCAAISQPAVCEKDPDTARAVNVPTHVINLLKQQQETSPSPALLLHLSTDQVYDGSKSMWVESDVCEPVNQYGTSKVQAEQYVQAQWPHSVILRSSIIYGPLPPDGLPHTPFLQFMAGAISKRQPTSFFNDQWRNPVYIMDVVRVVSGLLAAHVGSGAQPHSGPAQVFNMGGPQRLSRVDMAKLVASKLGLSPEESEQVVLSVASSTMSLAVASPPDISMNSIALEQHLGISMTAFADALEDMLLA